MHIRETFKLQARQYLLTKNGIRLKSVLHT